MTSGNASGVRKSKIQSIVWPGPAMKPSSDIALLTTTLPVSVSISRPPFQILGPGLNHKSGGGLGEGEAEGGDAALSVSNSFEADPSFDSRAAHLLRED